MLTPSRFGGCCRLGFMRFCFNRLRFRRMCFGRFRFLRFCGRRNGRLSSRLSRIDHRFRWFSSRLSWLRCRWLFRLRFLGFLRGFCFFLGFRFLHHFSGLGWFCGFSFLGWLSFFSLFCRFCSHRSRFRWSSRLCPSCFLRYRRHHFYTQVLWDTTTEADHQQGH